MYVRGYLQGSENGRVVTIDPKPARAKSGIQFSLILVTLRIFLFDIKQKNPRGHEYQTKYTLVATSADSVPSSYLVRITIAPIGTTFGNLQ